MSKQQFTQAIRAQFIASTLGTLRAAGFLRNRGFSLEQALSILVPGAKVRC